MKRFLKQNILIISIIIFLGLCLIRINTAPLWRDEAFSALVATNDWGKIIEIASKDTQPPLYLFLLHVSYLVAGKGEFAVRIWSVIGGLFTIIFAYKITSKITTNEWARILIAPIIIFNPVLFNYALEARPYAIFTALYLGAIYFSMRYSTEKNKKNLIIIFLLSLFGLYIHNLFIVCVVSVFALLIFLRFREKKKYLGIKDVINSHKDIILLGGALFIAYLPWLVKFLSQLKMVSSDGFWLQFDYLNSVQQVLAMSFAGGEYYYQQTELLFYILLVTVFLGIAGILVGWGKDLVKVKNKTPIFIIGSLLPFALSYLLSFKTPVLYIRYMIFLVPFFLISVVKVYQKKIFIIIIFLICSMVVTCSTLIIRPNMKEGYKDAIAQIQYNPKTDLILHKNALPVFGFRYYSDLPSYIYNKPEEIRYFEGKAAIEPKDYWQGDLINIQRIWVLDIWQDGEFDKKIEALGFIRVSEQKFDGDLYLYLYTK